MNKLLERIKKYGINADNLKIIAVVSMIIDHIAYYFHYIIPDWANTILHFGIGRIAMPIFAYLLVQGFFNTKNFKKYLLRITTFGIITQVFLLIGWAINANIFTGYSINVYNSGNILLSFSLTLILLKTIHEPKLIKKYDEKQNLIFKVIVVIVLLNLYIFIPMDYGVTVPLLVILLYVIERFRLTIMISKSNINTSFKGVVYKSLDDVTIKRIYCALILFAIILCIIYGDIYWTGIFSILPIYLYNGERKKKAGKFKYTYYVLFPVHHIILYFIAMVIYHNIY